MCAQDIQVLRHSDVILIIKKSVIRDFLSLATNQDCENHDILWKFCTNLSPLPCVSCLFLQSLQIIICMWHHCSDGHFQTTAVCEFIDWCNSTMTITNYHRVKMATTRKEPLNIPLSFNCFSANISFKNPPKCVLHLVPLPRHLVALQWCHQQHEYCQ